MLRRAIVAFFERRWLAVDETTGAIFDVVIEEPRLPEDARPNGFRDVVVFDVQLNVVARASTKRARRVFDDFQVGCFHASATNHSRTIHPGCS